MNHQSRLLAGSLCLTCRLIVLSLLLLLFTGCAGRLDRARNEFYRGHADIAASLLDEDKTFSKDDALLFYMEKGSINYFAGHFHDSISALLKASDIIEKQETLSVSNEAAAMLTTDLASPYKGEYAEHLWVHTFLMMAFLMTEAWDDALVEAKRAVEIMNNMPELFAKARFTRALAAFCFEATGDLNGAYIEYRKLADGMDDPSPILPKLYAIAEQLGFDDDASKYRQRLNHTGLRYAKNYGRLPELIFFISVGKAPVKHARDIILPPGIRFSFPAYDMTAPPRLPNLSIRPSPLYQHVVKTNIAKLLRASLNARMKQVLAKEAARAALKEAAVRQIDNEAVRTIARLALVITGQPDTRSWHVLPAFLMFVSIQVEPTETDNISICLDRKKCIDIVAESHLSKFQIFSVMEDGRFFSQAMESSDIK